MTEDPNGKEEGLVISEALKKTAEMEEDPNGNTLRMNLLMDVKPTE